MTTGTDPDTDRSQDLAATQNPSQRWLDELPSVDFSPLDQAIARSKALDRELEQARLARERQQEASPERDLAPATQLLHLEHEPGRLVSRIDELRHDLRSANDNLHTERRATHELTSQIALGVQALEARHSLRPEIRFFVLVMLLLALTITAWGIVLFAPPRVPPRAQGIWPPLAEAPPPRRTQQPLELTPASPP